MKYVKFSFASLMTVFLGWLTLVISRMVTAAWTNATMDMVRHNMGDLTYYRNIADLWSLAGIATWIVGAILIFVLWYSMYRKNVSK